MNDFLLQPAMKALIVHKGKVLILRESKHEESTMVGRYHLPGGRVQPGEHFLDTLNREVNEETGLRIDVVRPLYVGEWRPVIKGRPRQIIATFFYAISKNSNVRLSEEHDKYEWILPADYKNFDLVDPDDKVIEAYIELEQNQS